LTRKIIHVDMDAFYASVEQRDDPALKGKPVIVAWEGPRSVVCAASYEARTFGVRSAIPATRARRLCPSGIFIRPDFEKYRAVSRQIRVIFERHTPLVEFLSLDEAFLDVTRELTGLPNATETARVIRAEIHAETDLTASAGVAPNKFLAKIASDWKKPDGLFVIKPTQVDSFLLPLPVRKIPGVGKATESALHEMGIQTGADIRSRGETPLVERLGVFGHRLWELAHGIDERPVVPERESKSYSFENTFPEDRTLDEIMSFFRESAERFFDRALAKGLVGRTVTVKLRTGDFSTATRQLTLTDPPESVEQLLEAVETLVSRFDFAPGSRYRLAGIGFSKFANESADAVQRDLF
jgi:DNA polymerase-4